MLVLQQNLQYMVESKVEYNLIDAERFANTGPKQEVIYTMIGKRACGD